MSILDWSQWQGQAKCIASSPKIKSLQLLRCISNTLLLQGHQYSSCFQCSLALHNSVWSHCCFSLILSYVSLPLAPQVSLPVSGFPLPCLGAACIPLPGSRHLAAPKAI